MMHKWVISLFSIAGAFVICGIGGAAIADLFDIWERPVAGFFAAFGVVTLAYLSAPVRNRSYSTLIFVIGAICAWLITGESWWPEDYVTRAYQPTYMPFIITVTGGLIPLAIILYPAAKDKHKSLSD